MKIKDDTRINSASCGSCPFRDNGLDLNTAKITEIKIYLIKGHNHFCHSDPTNHTICRGGRSYQLHIWHRLGIITEPTDNALREALIGSGLKAKKHI